MGFGQIFVFIISDRSKTHLVIFFCTSQFLSSNAAADGQGALKGWIWPAVNNGKHPRHAFNDLVGDPDNTSAQSQMLDGIKTAWDETEHGVVIGSMLFDKVGENPDTGYDGVAAVQRVVDYVGVQNPEHVIVVLNYRTPKMSHWSAVYANHFDDGVTSYENFLCGDNQGTKKWEWLDTVMNPHKVAKAYFEQGWKVSMIDLAGTIDRGQDPIHVMACRIFQVPCDDNDYIIELGSNPIITPVETEIIDELTAEEQDELEAVFSERDCHYKYELENEARFTVYNTATSYWAECGEEFKSYYERFADTDFMVQLLQSQKQCADENVDVAAFLDSRDSFADSNGGGGDSSGSTSTPAASPVFSPTTSSSSETKDGDNKLVIFAGTHETGSLSVNEFLADNAIEGDSSAALKGWIWPSVESEIITKSREHVFGLLVTDESNEPVQNIVIDGIRDSWSDAEKGVVIGSIDFDKVGINPETGYDALQALHRVVNGLDIPDDDVTVAITYRTPRSDHFSAVWWNHFDAEDYDSFVCSDNQSDKRWEWIDTTLNVSVHTDEFVICFHWLVFRWFLTDTLAFPSQQPLKLAQAYSELGFKVVVIDADGVVSQGKDVAHVIACSVMQVENCKDEWVTGLESETVNVASTTRELDPLGSSGRADLESLFLMRDCYYWLSLSQNPNFSILHPRNLGNICSSSHMGVYEKLADTDFFLNAVRSQVDCETEDVNLNSLLAASSVPPSTNGGLEPIGLLVAVVALLIVVAIVTLFVVQRRRKLRLSKAQSQVSSPGVFKDSPSLTSTQPYKDGDNHDDGSSTPERYSDVDVDNSTDDFKEAVMA